jgi:hypothetical protein
MNLELRVKNLIFVIVSLIILHSALLTPVYAVVDISKEYAFGDLTNLGIGFSRLVAPGFAIAIVAVVFYFIIGGLKYLTSGGDKETISSAQKMITHAIIGFILLIFLFLAIEFLFGKLLGTNIQFIKGL